MTTITEAETVKMAEALKVRKVVQVSQVDVVSPDSQDHLANAELLGNQAQLALLVTQVGKAVQEVTKT